MVVLNYHLPFEEMCACHPNCQSLNVIGVADLRETWRAVWPTAKLRQPAGISSSVIPSVQASQQPCYQFFMAKMCLLGWQLGQGNNLCFYLVPLAASTSAVGVVISPLNALMDQQVICCSTSVLAVDMCYVHV